MKIQNALFHLLLSCCLVSGCTTVHGMEKSRPAYGNTMVYDVPYEKAFELGLYACQILNFEVESQNKTEKCIVAKNGISAWSWGERIGIYFHEINTNQTQVSIISKAKLKTNIFAPKWAGDMHQAMQTRLAQLKHANAS